jgi:hypothetical protein
MIPIRMPHRFLSPRAECAAWLLAALACAFFVCSSVFFFNGSRVDESEVVLNALAIAAGGWSPEWSPGYGHLAMYLPGAVIGIAALFLQATGAAANHTDALYLLFEHEAVYRITRFVYALADAGTALVFARLITRGTGLRLIAVASIGYFMLSPDTWQYANFVRTDTLVSFFAAVAAYVMVRPRTKATPYLLGIALGAAIACKYSAVAYLALVLLLLVPDAGMPATLRQRLAMAATAGVVACAATFAFQPRFDYSGILSALEGHLSGSKFAHEALPMGERMSRLWALVKGLEPFAALFLASMWLGLLRPRQSAPVLLLVLVGIGPFALSNFPRDYWLIPFADALRAAGWLGLACTVQALQSRAVSLGRVAVGLVVLGLAVTAVVRLPELQRTRRDPHRSTNAEAAKRWLYINVANREHLVYAYEKNYLLPRAYSFRSYDAAAGFSRVFIFHRENFDSLRQLFRRLLYTTEYAEFTSATQVPPLWMRVESDRIGPPPRLCAGERCYSAKASDCGVRTPRRGRQCREYVWNMGRPEYRMSLTRMSLDLHPSVRSFGLCWYNCRRGALAVPAKVEGRGSLPFVDLAKYLFAPADVRSLRDIRRLPATGRRIFIVTTPTAYEPWLAGSELPLKARRKPDAFARLIGARLVQRFHEGHGPVIEVYEKVSKPGR